MITRAGVAAAFWLMIVFAGGTFAAEGGASLPFNPTACPGCCSSHGGITNSCGVGGRVLCADGTTSPSCSCSSCGVSGGGSPLPSSCNYTYADWSPCQSNGIQTRVVLNASPLGCSGTPITTQSCVYTPPSCTYTYSEWGACQPTYARFRSVLGSSPSGCTGTPLTAEACTYVAPDTGAVNYSGMYWNAQESGWGLNISHQDSTLFGTIFLYSTTGSPMWLMASSMAKQPSGSYSGELFRVTGPPFNKTPWSAVKPTSVGTMTIAFTSSTAGELIYSVGGTVTRKQVVRFTFGAIPAVCSVTTANRTSATNYQDFWWNAQESGWGLHVLQEGNTVFSTLFSYDASGIDMWLVASDMPRQADGSFTGPLFSMAGTPFATLPWHGPTPRMVGQMTLRFSSGESGTLTYSVDGTTVVKSISRYTFGASMPVCH